MTVFSQQKDSSNICLTGRQFDFYARALVERNGLRQDTSVLNAQLKLQNSLLVNNKIMLGNCSDIITQKDIIIDVKKKDFDKLTIDYTKSQKKLKTYQQTTLIFICTTLLAGIFVVLK
ncbi:hypothetical protein CCP3SC1AL1_350015 [Gammaproteobacteria bacterium]